MPKYLRRNFDGAIVEITQEFDPENEFWWTDGNFGCDCNREIAFETITGKAHHSYSGKCGDTRFDVLD